MDKSPLAVALEDAEACGPDSLVNLLARLLMCYHDFDVEICRHPDMSYWAPLPAGVNRKNGGYFLHAQYLVGLP
jgi:hypothetical protein